MRIVKTEAAAEHFCQALTRTRMRGRRAELSFDDYEPAGLPKLGLDRRGAFGHAKVVLKQAVDVQRYLWGKGRARGFVKEANVCRKITGSPPRRDSLIRAASVNGAKSSDWPSP